MKTVTVGTIKGGDGKSSLCILLSLIPSQHRSARPHAGLGRSKLNQLQPAPRR